jgi:hypothetical protein
MAREPVAVDFLGIGSRRDRELEMTSEEKGDTMDVSRDDDPEISRPRLALESSLTFSLGPVASLFEEKRLEELSRGDIMEMSVDDMRRYILKIKEERGERLV